MRALPALATLIVTLALRAGAADAPAKRVDPGVQEDLARIQGTFAHEVRDRQGKSLGRIVK